MKSARFAGNIVGTGIVLLPLLDTAVFIAAHCYSVTGASGSAFAVLLWLILLNALALFGACVSIYFATKGRQQNEARRIYGQN